MPRQFFTAADIIQLARQQKSTLLVLGPDDVVTHEAEDAAQSLGIRLVREMAGSPPLAAPPALPPLKRIEGLRVVTEPFGDSPQARAASVRLKDVITAADGSPMAGGYMTLERGEFPWTLTYDEIDIVLSGELVITRGSESVRAGPGDMIFIPRGSSITFGAPGPVRFIYVTFPADWDTAK